MFNIFISELTFIGVYGLDVKFRRNRVLFRILNSWERKVTMKGTWNMLISQAVVLMELYRILWPRMRLTSIKFLWTKSVGSSSQIKLSIGEENTLTWEFWAVDRIVCLGRQIMWIPLDFSLPGNVCPWASGVAVLPQVLMGSLVDWGVHIWPACLVSEENASCFNISLMKTSLKK